MPDAMPVPRLFSFIGGSSGSWSVAGVTVLAGEPLVTPERVEVVAGNVTARRDGDAWVLRGITSNERYVIRNEKTQLVAVQQGLGRPDSTCAVMIPMRKNDAWWALTQDERRAIFEDQSHHVQIGLKYLPPIARRLHHCRDLSEREPFDFITWFEFAPEHESRFDDLLTELRRTDEWKFVDREVEVRLRR
jgi:hypothetical protein